MIRTEIIVGNAAAGSKRFEDLLPSLQQGKQCEAAGNKGGVFLVGKHGGLLARELESPIWAAREALSQFGAELSHERVCVDRNRLTGGGITAGVDFGITVAGHWAGESMGRVIELLMEYAPQPPY